LVRRRRTGEGDFASAGSLHIDRTDKSIAQVTAGSFDYKPGILRNRPEPRFVRGYTLQFGLGLPSILETIVLTAMRAEVARTSPNCAPPYSAAPEARWVSYQN
jgi:hypothetical protein